jgi:hypothetical protein
MLGGALMASRRTYVGDRKGGAGIIIERPSRVTWIEQGQGLEEEYIVVVKSLVGDMWFESSRHRTLKAARAAEKAARPIDVGQ